MIAADLKSAAARDSEKASNELARRFEWVGEGESGKRIQAVIDSAKTNNDEDLIMAVVNEHQDKGPLKYGAKVTVMSAKMSKRLFENHLSGWVRKECANRVGWV